jgi:hypothetical protein
MVPSWIRFLAGIKNCYPPHMSHEGRRKEHIATRTSIYSQIHKFLLAQCRIMLNRLELIELNKLTITKCKKTTQTTFAHPAFQQTTWNNLDPSWTSSESHFGALPDCEGITAVLSAFASPTQGSQRRMKCWHQKTWGWYVGVGGADTILRT